MVFSACTKRGSSKFKSQMRSSACSNKPFHVAQGSWLVAPAETPVPTSSNTCGSGRSSFRASGFKTLGTLGISFSDN